MDDEEPQCKVLYLDGEGEETNWIKRSGKCQVTYPNGDTFEGEYDTQKLRQGYGVYQWMAPASEEDETLVVKSKYSGDYKDGLRHGFGVMEYPNGDIYTGNWVENRMEGNGTYDYKKTGDIYSGLWLKNKKHGEGVYQFGKDYSCLKGVWENGTLTKGTWIQLNHAEYEGTFNQGRPIGEGKFTFNSGLVQTGSFEVRKPKEDEEEEEEEENKLPNVEWKGKSIVSF